jgi:hypothetical protein
MDTGIAPGNEVEESMVHRARMAVLLAASFFHGACSAEQPITSASPVADASSAAARVSVRAAPREAARKSEMTQERIVLSSPRGRVTAELIDNEATRALAGMLPITLEMRDHLRQEKTGSLPSDLPEVQRQTGFSAGTLGLWGNDDFVIYYRSGQVPSPGIVILGRVTGDVAIFDRPGPATVRIEQAD